MGRAAAVAEIHGASAGWELLEALPGEETASYQAYWALAAHLLERMGRGSEAEPAYRRAIGLCEDTAMRDFLVARLHEVRNS